MRVQSAITCLGIRLMQQVSMGVTFMSIGIRSVKSVKDSRSEGA
jgi:hypothetical protein